MALFGIPDNVWLDKNTVNIVTGIAGASKTGDVVEFYGSRGCAILYLPITHQLRKAGIIRFENSGYNIEVRTLASAMGNDENTGAFYGGRKEPTKTIVIIDEPYQSNKQVFEWVDMWKGQYKFVLLGDSHQMLSPDQEDMVDVIKDYETRPYVSSVELTYSKRPVTDRTRDEYNYYYNIDGDYVHNVELLKKKYPTIPYNQMPFDINACYIYHTNAAEHFTITEKRLMSIPGIPTIVKGVAAAKDNAKVDNIPIVSQYAAEHGKFSSYRQLMYHGTPTRWQGREIPQGTKAYYIISDTSKIINREMYTTVTRFKDIADLTIVINNNVPDLGPVKTYCGLPVKRRVYLHIPYEFDEQGTKVVTQQEMYDFLAENYPDTDEIYYDKQVVYSTKIPLVDSTVIMKKDSNVVALFVNNYKGKKKLVEYKKVCNVTVKSLVKRDGSLNFTYAEQIYRELERVGLDNLRPARILNKTYNDCYYDVDLTNSYPEILKYCDMPAEGVIYHTPSPDLINWYVYRKTGKKAFITNESLITEQLANVISQEGLGKVEYLFSTPKQVGCSVGDFLFGLAHVSKESKDAVKKMEYGYWEKNLLEKSEKGDCYIYNENYKYEILMCAICSMQCYYAYNLSKAIGGKYIHVDAVHFDYKPDDTIVDKIKSVYPDFLEWKVEDLHYDKGDPNRIMYCNYASLKTRNQIKNEQAKAKRAAMTEEELEAKREKDRERQRAYREKKKLEKQNQI